MNTIDKCLCCEAGVLPLMDFGPQSLVNTYSVQDKFPLSVNRCVGCCHLQLSQFVDRATLYQDYAYCSNTGRTAREYFKNFAQTALDYFPTARTMLDIACNDGSQMDAFSDLGLKTCGVEPAMKIALKAAERGHIIDINFLEQSQWIGGRTFDILVAQNVIAHTPTPLDFLKACSEMMHESSKLFIATSQANMVVNGECDCIYHEHISYFNAHSMLKLAQLAGLTVLDILMNDIHGTSFIFVLGKSGNFSQRVEDRLEWEWAVGMLSPPLYRWWRTHVQAKMERVNHQIRGYSKKGYYTVGLGAAAKGISMLNMADVKLDLLVDSTPSKFGHVSNGMQIAPFASIAALKHEKVAFVVLAWNVKNEIVSNARKLRDNPCDLFVEVR